MNLRHLLLLSLLAAPAAPAALTVVQFAGSPQTLSGPGSLAVTGDLPVTYGTVSSYGLAAIPGGDPTVLSFAAPGLNNSQGLTFTHATASPNTTGYTILMDVYYSAIPNYVSLLQLDNDADGDLFGRSAGSIGISGIYEGTGFTANAWHRVVFTMSGAQDSMQIYVDGILANGSVVPANPGRYDLSDPTFLVFGDEDGESAAGYISLFGFDDRAYSPLEVGALGGASVVPEPAGATLLAGVAALGLLTRRRTARAARR